MTITQDHGGAVKSDYNKRESEASFYSLYTAGSSFSIDLDIWENEVGADKIERKNSKGSSNNSSKDVSEKNSKGSHNSYSEFCVDTTNTGDMIAVACNPCQGSEVSIYRIESQGVTPITCR